jgi:hypothetical protein
MSEQGKRIIGESYWKQGEKIKEQHEPKPRPERVQQAPVTKPQQPPQKKKGN